MTTGLLDTSVLIDWDDPAVTAALADTMAISAITLGVARLKPAAPSLERATALIETVKRGPMLRDVHGTGTLVAEVAMMLVVS